MRKLKTNNRLIFNKAAVTELNNNTLNNVIGGTSSSSDLVFHDNGDVYVGKVKIDQIN